MYIYTIHVPLYLCGICTAHTFSYNLFYILHEHIEGSLSLHRIYFYRVLDFYTQNIYYTICYIKYILYTIFLRYIRCTTRTHTHTHSERDRWVKVKSFLRAENSNAIYVYKRNGDIRAR